MTAPLTGPDFGSYPAADVRWLLKDLSGVDLEADVAERERRIQSGRAHYAESLPIEYQPDAQYRELFDKVLVESAERLARAVGVVTELILEERGHDITLVSLARAGTPIGILMRRWAMRMHGLDLPHYAVSIVRDRGIDTAALDYLAAHHDPASVVFVDGWTGKGAITRELDAALAAYAASGGAVFDPDLAVLADPGSCARTYGTRDDFLIASACLNSTVSGLVSRTVLNDALIAPGEFHGAKFYRELAAADVSNDLLDTIGACFPDVQATVEETSPPSDPATARRPGRAGPRSRRSARGTTSRRSTTSSPAWGDHPGAAAPRPVEGTGPGSRCARTRPHPSARGCPGRPGRGRARPAYSCMGLIKDVT